MIELSLIIPTYNRVDLLTKTLEACFSQSISSSLYEILIIDNNSTDNTKNKITSLMANAPCRWRYFLEEQQGVHHARNKGILEAQGDIIVFGDDDIIPTNDWLELISLTFKKKSEVGVVGGKVCPLWDKEPPSWIYDYGTSKTHFVFAYLDYGEQARRLQTEHLFSNNMALRRDVAIQVGGNPPCTFPKKLKRFSGRGENELQDKVRALGLFIEYDPAILVYHAAPVHRATHEYFIDRHERLAIEHVNHFFKKKNKKDAVYLICKENFPRLINATVLRMRNKWRTLKKKKLLPLHKIDPEFYLRLELSYSIQMLFQTVRILFSRNLYNYVNKNYYF